MTKEINNDKIKEFKIWLIINDINQDKFAERINVSSSALTQFITGVCESNYIRTCIKKITGVEL